MTATAPEGNLRGAAVAAVAASAAAAAGYHEGTKRLPRGTAGLEELAEAVTQLGQKSLSGRTSL